MSTELTTLQARVKERISETIASLIPDEELTALIEAQVQHFRRTELNQTIKSLIQQEMTNAIKDELNKPEWREMYTNHGQYGASLAVKTLITENSGQMLADMMGQIVQMTVNRMRDQMPRY